MIGQPRSFPQIDDTEDADSGDDDTDDGASTAATSQLGQPAVLGQPAEGRVATAFRRPPVLALFRPADEPGAQLLAGAHGCLAVVSVHLKSHLPTELDRSGLARTQAEVRRLAKSVVPWMETQVRTARKEDKGLASLGAATYVILGDFNLAEDDEKGRFGGNDGTTFGGDAWEDLKSKGFHALLPPGQPTNMGPPVCEHDKCYDNILYRRIADTTDARMNDVVPPVAQVYRAMQAEMEEMAGICKITNSARTDLVTRAVKGMKKAFQEEVFCTWSDHKPVYAHLSFGAPKVQELCSQSQAS